MITVKNRLIFGLIKKIIVTVFKAIFAVLNFLHLHLALIILVTGIILYLTGVLTNNYAVKVVFFLTLSGSVFYAIVATVYKLLGLGKPKKRGKVQVLKVESPEVEDDEQPQVVQEQKVYQPSAYNNPYVNQGGFASPPAQFGQGYLNQPQMPQSNFIGYFRVKQNPNYVMAEYTDRYELFVMSSDGLKKVRTDYK